MHLTGLVIVWVASLGIIGIGIAYWLRNEKNAEGFGLPVPPAPDARGWWQVKGIRDIVSGLVPITVMLAEPDALPWVVLVEALIPLGDMVIVLRHGGRTATAYGVHGLTALLMVIAGVLLLAS